MKEEKVSTVADNRALVIVSGGMDSVTLAYYLKMKLEKELTIVTFNYGQKHVRELRCAAECAWALGCSDRFHLVDLRALVSCFSSSALIQGSSIEIPDIINAMGDPQPVSYVPNRNMIMLACACALAESLEIHKVFYGAQAHDLYGYWDTTPQFLTFFNDVIALNRKSKLIVEAPFINMAKGELLQLGTALGVPFAKTWSCYNGREKACGTCPTCAERLKAFKENGIVDPLQYEEQEQVQVQES